MKILKFEAPWCKPCQQMTEMMKSVSLPVAVQRVDIDVDGETAQLYGVRSVPTLLLVDDDGNMLTEPLVGVQSAGDIAEYFGGNLLH